MREVGWTGSWRVENVVDGIEEKMFHVFTKGISVCYIFVNITFNGV
jgi:hypothetical protein